MSVCQRGNSNTYEWMSTEFCGMVWHGPRNKMFRFCCQSMFLWIENHFPGHATRRHAAIYLSQFWTDLHELLHRVVGWPNDQPRIFWWWSGLGSWSVVPVHVRIWGHVEEFIAEWVRCIGCRWQQCLRQRFETFDRFKCQCRESTRCVSVGDEVSEVYGGQVHSKWLD